MSEDQERAKELWEPVTDPLMAGWTQQKNRGGMPIRFRNPAGEQMGARQYGAIRKSLREGTQTTKQEPSLLVGVPDLPVADLDKPDAAIKKAGLATPEELAEGAYIGIILLLGLAGFLLKVPEITPTREEAWAFAVPLGNILERSVVNRRYGKYLKEGSDYLYLGYALYAYGTRVQQSIQARQMQEQQIGRSGSINAQAPASSGLPPPGPGLSPSPAGPLPSPNGATPTQPTQSTPSGPANDNRREAARSLPFTPKVG